MSAHIRLFLFPVKPESIGSSLLDPKSKSLFSDALKSTQILQKGESADRGFVDGPGLRERGQVEIGSNNGGGGFESKHGVESLVLDRRVHLLARLVLPFQCQIYLLLGWFIW
ncbi:uncharacterized protein Fot_50513 [Forsythia ovata]|uniref:Uncharacterized protein n=1 Tax=Forsythia ovata TaxID=205694 RepID=A0ABD1PZB8_9LAMI